MNKCEFLTNTFTQEMQFTDKSVAQKEMLDSLPSPTNPPLPKGTVCASTSIKILKFKIKREWNFLKGEKIHIMLDFTEGTLTKTSFLVTESQIQNQL